MQTSGPLYECMYSTGTGTYATVINSLFCLRGLQALKLISQTPENNITPVLPVSLTSLEAIATASTGFKPMPDMLASFL
jgi:hypothetical protein